MSVNPARAGMIRGRQVGTCPYYGKPRASGDDPPVLAVSIAVLM